MKWVLAMALIISSLTVYIVMKEQNCNDAPVTVGGMLVQGCKK